MKIGDRLYSGSINISGVLEARVSKVYEDSTASRILELVENANNNKAQSESFADKFSRFYTPVVTLIGVLVMILPPLMLQGADQETWLYRGLIFLVAACPCRPACLGTSCISRRNRCSIPSGSAGQREQLSGGAFENRDVCF